jgi:hypothetical protein
VLRQIQAGDSTWTEHVPQEVADVIKERGFFGYKKPRAKQAEAPSIASPFEASRS